MKEQEFEKLKEHFRKIKGFLRKLRNEYAKENSKVMLGLIKEGDMACLMLVDTLTILQMLCECPEEDREEILRAIEESEDNGETNKMH